jgi:hypothetical protein
MQSETTVTFVMTDEWRRTTMHAVVRTYEASDTREVARRASHGFVPILRGTPGFIAYYIVDGGSGSIASISVFEDEAGTDESTRRAAEWVADNIAELVVSGPKVLAGQVTVEARQ